MQKRLLPGSFNDHRSLVDAVSSLTLLYAISGVYGRSHQILLNSNLLRKNGNALRPGRITFDDKMVVREKPLKKLTFPSHMLLLTALLVTSLLAFVNTPVMPPGTLSIFLGDANQKVCLIFVNEDDIATYTIKTIDDPKTLNKTLHLRPPKNMPPTGLFHIWRNSLHDPEETLSLLCFGSFGRYKLRLVRLNEHHPLQHTPPPQTRIVTLDFLNKAAPKVSYHGASVDSHQVTDFGDYQVYLFVLANNEVSNNYVDQESADFEAFNLSGRLRMLLRDRSGILNVLDLNGRG
ncbi:hypothetical protein HAX54_046803 [Datura stramonium]|uniref:Uncharacterized protein n=1 Tax=Datura stramonium TaxID=4076 RepID=A0ABS8ST55_DATST|nr:hypothetical protein [Datura stramonium]